MVVFTSLFSGNVMDPHLVRYALEDLAVPRVLSVCAAPDTAPVRRCLLGDASVMVRVAGWLRALG